MRARLHRLAPVAGALLFGLALWALHHALRDVHYRDVVRELRELPPHRVAEAALAAALGYTCLTFYDTLAVRYVGHALQYRRIALASFVGYAFSHTLGVPLLSGGAIRYRLYSAWGLSAAEIAGILAFNGLTFWLGFATLGGILFTTHPLRVPPELHLPFHNSLRVVGVVLLVLVVAYVVLGLVRRTPLVIRGREIAIPSPRLMAPQIVVALLDWTLAGTTLWALLPPAAHLTLWGVLGVFLLAQTAGISSHVPGGLGVFETVALVLLTPALDAQTVVGSLLAFRAVYYLAPLVLASLALGVHELQLRPTVTRRIAHLFEDWGSAVVPQVLALGVFLSGTLLLFSNATPDTPVRLTRLVQVVPLPVLEASHFLASLVGFGLVLVAYDVQRRVDAAYVTSAVLLAAGIVLSLLKGLTVENSIALAIMLAALLPCRPQFYRRTPLLAGRLSPGWATAVVLAIASTIWLFGFAHRHVPYARDLWGQFEVHAGAARALRATTGVVLAAIVAGVWLLRRRVPSEPAVPTPADLDRARAIVGIDASTLGNLALLGDKRLLFSDTERGFVMYRCEGRSWVALGDPVGADDEAPELAWRFRELADRHDGLAVFYQVEDGSLPLYLDLGLTLLTLGDVGRVRLADFSLAGGRAALREPVDRLADDGWTVRVVPPAEVSARMEELRAISDAWLAARHIGEKGFATGAFSPDYLRRFPAAFVERDGELLAFANLWSGGTKEELAVDFARHRPSAPRDLLDFLLVRLMQWGRREGYAWFNLGMTPLAGFPEHALAPLWDRAGVMVFRHGEHFDNFQALRAAKERFEPTWSPRHLAAPGGLALPRVLDDVATLLAGGLDGRRAG